MTLQEDNLIFSMAEERWTRPDSVPFPTEWRRFQGKTQLPDGRFPQFHIQDTTEDMYEAVVEHMTSHYLREEPMCVSLHAYEDPVAVREVQALWHVMLRQRMALVALMDAPSRIVGCNVTFVRLKTNKSKMQFEAEPGKKMVAAMEYIRTLADPFEHFGVDKYMMALGLSVHPEFRGQGIGEQLLLARFDLGRAVGLPLTASVFTSINSQILAHRIGMVLLAEIAYEDYKPDGKVVFPGVKTKFMKLMAKRILPESETTADSESP